VPGGLDEVWADEPVRIVPYDPAWRDTFVTERRLLQDALGDRVVGGIHHVGSTAVPGLAAKPTIDILVGVSGLEAGIACFAALESLGYLYAPYRVAEMHWFCKPHPSRRTHHLHLVPVDTRRFGDELAFRDHLIAHPEDLAAYAALKRQLAKQFRYDRTAYTEAKSDFIQQCLRSYRRRAASRTRSDTKTTGRSCPTRR
jgi:GrpB-like predicted nucleotidyltransferase (UPF0157 family)